MNTYTFYLPGVDKLMGLSQEDWQFLCERAEENNVLPATLASRIIANELAQWRDEIHYAEQQEALQANAEMNMEKVIEEIV
jgi:hypothetical protein